MTLEFSLPTISDGEDKSSVLMNCIRNKYRHLRKWAKRTQTNCFRIYDRDIPYIPLAIDFYDGRFCIQYFSKGERASSKTFRARKIDDFDASCQSQLAGSCHSDECPPNRVGEEEWWQESSKGRFCEVGKFWNWLESEDPPPLIESELNHALQGLFGAGPTSIYWRTRIRRERLQQYEKVGESKEFFTVLEYGVKFRINLVDYLDTGLFLDHRETRKMVASFCKGKRVLNLFAYTCSFSVHAAIAGASFTKSVDMSNTYTEWGKENFLLNRIALENNPIIRADCLKFLDEERSQYDLIIIDPPTISRSKKMDQMFDIQVDYIGLIKKSLRLLTPDGIIFFSTNSRKFVFDETQFKDILITEISTKTIPIDFHDPKIHRCWKLQPRFLRKSSTSRDGDLQSHE